MHGGGQRKASSRMMQSPVDTSTVTRTEAEGKPSKNNEASHLLPLQSPQRPWRSMSAASGGASLNFTGMKIIFHWNR